MSTKPSLTALFAVGVLSAAELLSFAVCRVCCEVVCGAGADCHEVLLSAVLLFHRESVSTITAAATAASQMSGLISSDLVGCLRTSFVRI